MSLCCVHSWYSFFPFQELESINEDVQAMSSCCQDMTSRLQVCHGGWVSFRNVRTSSMYVGSLYVSVIVLKEPKYINECPCGFFFFFFGDGFLILVNSKSLYILSKLWRVICRLWDLYCRSPAGTSSLGTCSKYLEENSKFFKNINFCTQDLS